MNSENNNNNFFLPWIILINNIITLFCSFFAAILSILLLICHHRNRHLVPYSPIMNLYIFFIILTGFIASSASTFMLIFWRPNNSIYNAKILFILGGISSQVLTYIPLIELFLCADRCLSIIFPTKYTNFQKNFLAFFATFIYLTFFIIYNYATNILSFYPTTIKTDCMVFSCQKNRDSMLTTVLIKSIIAIANVLGTLILGYLMKIKISAITAIRRINLVVFYMLLSTIIFVFIPNLAAVIAHLYYFKMPDYIGPYGATLTTVNMAVCSLMYWRMFRKSITSSSTQPNVVAAVGGAHTSFVTPINNKSFF